MKDPTLGSNKDNSTREQTPNDWKRYSENQRLIQSVLKILKNADSCHKNKYNEQSKKEFENFRKYTIEKEINNSLFKKNLELQRKIKEVQIQCENKNISSFIEQKYINYLVLELQKRNKELENIKIFQKKLTFENFILPDCAELEEVINKIKESECRIFNFNKFEQKFNENKSGHYYVCDDTYEKMGLIYDILKKYIRKNFEFLN